MAVLPTISGPAGAVIPSGPFRNVSSFTNSKELKGRQVPWPGSKCYTSRKKSMCFTAAVSRREPISHGVQGRPGSRPGHARQTKSAPAQSDRQGQSCEESCQGSASAADPTLRSNSAEICHHICTCHRVVLTRSGEAGKERKNKSKGEGGGR